MSCTYGASVRAGLSPTTEVLVDRSLWETVTGTPSSWWDWLLGIFPLTYITASDLCALNLTDPVLPPLSTIAAAFFRDPSSIVTVYNYVRDKLTYSAFATACVCNAAPSVCSTAPWPANTENTNFGCTSAQSEVGMRFTAVGASCTGGVHWTGPTGSWSGATLRLWDAATGTVLATEVITTGAPASSYPFSWSAGPVTLVPGNDYVLSVRKLPSTCYGGNTDNAAPTGQGAYYTFVNWVGDFGTAMPVSLLTVRGPVSPTVCVTGSPTTPTAPNVPAQPTDLPLPPAWTCTTVGDVCTRLLQISEKIDWLIRAAPSVTSSSVAEGTVHSGLTGSGTLAVSGILGLRVLLTTIPSTYGSYPGNPTVHFGVGRVHWQTAEGWLQESLLDVTPKEILDLPPLVTTIGYTLAGGVVATIVELTKGP